MLKNPFFVYIATFGGVLGIYALGWSELLPPLSVGTLTFFLFTFATAFSLGLLIAPLIKDTCHYDPGLLPKYSVLFFIVTFAAEVALNGIPVLRVMRGENFYLLEAGARHLHVFSLWSVYSVIRFADFAYSRRPLYLLEAFLPVIAYGLFVYRGPALIVLLSWAFIFIIRVGRIRVQYGALALVAALSVLYVNGRIGDMRSPDHANLAGLPSESFKNSGIPSSFFWTYLYVTVPIGNLQLSSDKITEPKGTAAEFVVSELIVDTFSKRIMPLVNPRITSSQGHFGSRDQLYSWEQPKVGHGMNISTIYGRAYGYFGWVGPLIMFGVLSLFIITYTFAIARSAFRVPCLALLNTLVVFCLFNNVLVSAVMAPLLVWPLLYPWAWWRRPIPQATAVR